MIRRGTWRLNFCKDNGNYLHWRYDWDEDELLEYILEAFSNDFLGALIYSEKSGKFYEIGEVVKPYPPFDR